MSDVSRETDDRPDLDLAWVRALDPYARLLHEVGVERGLIGPRELPRLWSRHLLNCAVVVLDDSLVPQGAEVIDVGSGAGLPGLVWALVRPDLRVTCLDSLLRRTEFLGLAVERLGLRERVHVLRGRAEEQALRADVVTARAVAPLERLLGWTLPLTRLGGCVVAFKGAEAATELSAAGDVLRRFGAGEPELLTFGSELLAVPTTVLSIPRVR